MSENIICENALIEKEARDFLKFAGVILCIPFAMLIVTCLINIGVYIYSGAFFNPFLNLHNLPMNVLGVEAFITSIAIVFGILYLSSTFQLKKKYLVGGCIVVFISMMLCCLILHLSTNAMV